MTGLSIVIGILTVTLMGTLISGLDKGFDKSMDFLGKDVLSISRWEWFGGQEWWEVRNRPRIKLEYVDKIQSKSKYAEAVAPVMQRGASLTRGDLGARSQIFGTTTDYLNTTNYGVAKGRFFTNSETMKNLSLNFKLDYVPSSEVISTTLFKEWYPLLEIASILLLGTIIGCLTLLKLRKGDS